jgi:hypothetical protein
MNGVSGWCLRTPAAVGPRACVQERTDTRRRRPYRDSRTVRSVSALPARQFRAGVAHCRSFAAIAKVWIGRRVEGDDSSPDRRRNGGAVPFLATRMTPRLTDEARPRRATTRSGGPAHPGNEGHQAGGRPLRSRANSSPRHPDPCGCPRAPPRLPRARMTRPPRFASSGRLESLAGDRQDDPPPTPVR